MRYIYKYEYYQIEVYSKTVSETFLSYEDYMIFYMMKGDSHVSGGEGDCQLKEEELYLAGCGERIVLWPETDAVWICLIFSRDLLDRYLGGTNVYPSRGLVQDSGDEPNRLIRHLKELINYSLVLKKNKKSLRMDILFFELLEILAQGFCREESAGRGSDSEDTVRNLVISYVEQNFRRAISLQEVSEAAAVEYHSLSRNFKTIFGMGFYELLNTVRLNHACQDLQNSAKSITQIAMENGYESSAVFSRVFRKRFRVSPRDYRKELEAGQQSSYEIPPLPVPGKSGQEIFCPENAIFLTADAAVPRPYTMPFTKMINGGHASDLLRADLQKSLTLIKKELPFSYVRFFNPFCGEMEIREEHRTDVLNFEKLDQILDFLVETGFTPWIDFGDKPKNIVRRVGRETVLNQGETSPPIFRSREEFRTLLEKFILHIRARYGKKEISSWIYEFWDDYFRPDRQKGGETVGYYEAFDLAVSVVKRWVPEAKIGGAGDGTFHVQEEFFRGLSGHQKPDFFSCICFPYSDPLENSGGGMTYIAETDFFPEMLDKIRDMQRQCGYDMPVYISEFSSNVSNRDFMNDSCYQAAWCMKNAILCVDQAEMGGYWCASDASFTAFDTSAEIFGGSGLLTKSGIRKPVYFVFEFLKQLGGRLIGLSDGGIITMDEDGSFIIAVQNYQPLGYMKYFQYNERFEAREFIGRPDRGRTGNFHITLSHVPDGRYRCQYARMGPSRGGMLEEWSHLDYSAQFSMDELDYLRKMCVPRIEKKYIRAERGTLELDFPVDAQEIALVKVFRA